MADNFFDSAFSSTTSRKGGGAAYVVARVTKVVYGPFLEDGETPDPDYEGVASIGSIRYVVQNSAQYLTNTGDSNKLARPIFSFIHQYPTENEYVILVMGPAVVADTDQVELPDVYYFPPVNLWKAANHNAQPTVPEYYDYINRQTADYLDTERGNVEKTSNSNIEYPLGNNFIERGDVRNLRVFPGDILFEGRYGQSIRFGSSLRENEGSANWAISENEADPITIIRNGQGRQTSQFPFSLTVEDINVDQSSIYLTAGQLINIADLQNFPLTSWNVSIQAAQRPVVIQMLFPPTVNDNFSPEAQDKEMLSGEQTGQFGNQPTSSVIDPGAQDYINYYKNLSPERRGDGFDSYYHYLLDKAPKTERQVDEWAVIKDLGKDKVYEVSYPLSRATQKQVDSGNYILVEVKEAIKFVVPREVDLKLNEQVRGYQLLYWDVQTRDIKKEYR